MKVCVTPIETDIQNIDIDAGHENGRDVRREPASFNNKGTGIGHDDLDAFFFTS